MLIKHLCFGKIILKKKKMIFHSSALFLAVVLCSARLASAVFGESVDDDVIDERFKNVGQAYIGTFAIVNNDLDFEVVVEDTVDENEYWVVDFQPYNKNSSKLPIDGETGDIIPQNTGSCSNIIDQGNFNQAVFNDGYYFTDLGNFKERNITRAQQLTSNSKHLFTSYVRGGQYDDVDIRGLPVVRQDYKMSFMGNFGFFFNCTTTNYENIWKFSNTSSTVEFKTTIYFTNVRPVDNTDGSMGISFVSSSTELIYRLNRVAILNFIISSVALVKPVLDYVIIEPYIVAGVPIVGRAKVEIRYHTIIQSTEGEALSYVEKSLNYTSREGNIDFESIIGGSINVTKCTFNNGGQECTQEWYFILILNIEDDIIQNDVPVDATGTFTFLFEQQQCTSVITEPPTSCVSMGIEPFFISMEITIQTVVTVVDTETDTPSIILLALTGEDGADLRGGASAGRRGVNYLETVSMKVQYSPEFLWEDFDLTLMLFMVCKNDQTSNTAGCLAVEVANRYVAYYHNDFEFSYEDSGNIYYFNVSSLDSDGWSPTGNETTQQMLISNGYDTSTSTYSIEFVNTALAQQRLEYTITTVYRLVGKARRKRDVGEDFGDMVVYSSRRRFRRDIMSTINLPHGHVVKLETNGCPPGSMYHGESRNCHCLSADEYYSTDTWQCESLERYTDEEDFIEVVDIDDDDESSASSTKMNFDLFIIGVFCYLMYFIQ